ncbi:hypothetical protein AMECASPLE_035316 [Ameca splendens]|uniref:Uncharacterized protein n=1 Tax=Ameca splendens TaxID=208324 RepID=A0ABV1ADP8_9TELE
MPLTRVGGPHAKQHFNCKQHSCTCSKQTKGTDDLLIRFFTLSAELCACEQLVNDRGSQGVLRSNASGHGSLHSLLPLIHPLFFQSVSAITMSVRFNILV